ncbi:MAG: hypothetical protein OXO51_17250 [Gemmatimonadota bacterium]|nr:hypothetical protein [Gemmatimonadota bacterium]
MSISTMFGYIHHVRGRNNDVEILANRLLNRIRRELHPDSHHPDQGTVTLRNERLAVARRKAEIMSTESTNHEGRIGRLEGINEQIDKRLSRIETVVIGQLVMTVAILLKLFIS